MNVELFSRIKTLQVEQMSVKRGPRPFLKIWKGGPSNFLIIWTKKNVHVIFLKQGLYFRDVSQSKSQGSKDVQIILSCSVKKSRSHTESRLCKVQITTFDNTLAILKSYKERGQRKSSKEREKATEKAKFCILHILSTKTMYGQRYM